MCNSREGGAWHLAAIFARVRPPLPGLKVFDLISCPTKTSSDLCMTHIPRYISVRLTATMRLRSSMSVMELLVLGTQCLAVHCLEHECKSSVGDMQAGREQAGPEEPCMASAGSTGSSNRSRRQRTNAQDWNAQIEKDLHRTFPGLPVMDSTGRRGLRHVLAAYACRNPAVGYCQVWQLFLTRICQTAANISSSTGCLGITPQSTRQSRRQDSYCLWQNQLMMR